MRILFAIQVLVNLSPVWVPVHKCDTLHIAVIQLGVIVLQRTSTLALSLHTNKIPTTPLHNINCSQQSTCTSPWTTTIKNIDWSTEYAVTYMHNNKRKNIDCMIKMHGSRTNSMSDEEPMASKKPNRKKKLHLKQNLQWPICLHQKKTAVDSLGSQEKVWINYRKMRMGNAGLVLHEITFSRMNHAFTSD